MAPLAISPALRLVQASFAIFFCFASAGVIFGFAALKPALIRHGVYRELCTGASDGPGPTMPCVAQDLRLNYMFTLSTVVTNAFALPVGLLLDHIGPKYTSLLGAVIFGLGNFFFGLQIVKSYIDTYFVGFILLAIGGPLIFLSSFHLSNVFPKRSGLLLSFITGAFDCSSLPYLVYNELDKRKVIPLKFFFWGYVIIPMILIIEQIFIGPSYSYKLGDFDAEPGSCPPPSSESTSSLTDTSSLTARPHFSRIGSSSDVEHEAIESPRDSEEGTIRPTDLSDTTNGPANADPLTGVMFDRSLKEQLSSSYFWIILFFLCIYMCRINYYIQTVSQQLLYYIHEPALANRISTAFTALLPLGGIVGIPIIGYILDAHGTPVASLVILISGLAYGLLGMLPNFVWAHLISIGVFVVLRPLMYTFVSDYTSKTFGFTTFGTVYGLINASSGVFSLVLRPLDIFTKETMEGNYTPVNLLGVVLGGVSAGLVVWRIKWRRRGGVRLEGDD